MPATATQASATGKFLRPGRVVILLNGRFAGRKAVIVRTLEEKDKVRPYGCCLVAGIERYPKKVTMAMPKSKIAKRSKIKPFVKIVNYTHLMPTRFSLDVDLKNVTLEKIYGEHKNRRATKRQVKKAFEDRYKTGKNKWFFAKLRF
jgi:large subunit ribosomal protein L27e